jgi:hypothetical protein
MDVAGFFEWLLFATAGLVLCGVVLFAMMRVGR